MAVQNLLLLVEARRLGALYFGDLPQRRRAAGRPRRARRACCRRRGRHRPPGADRSAQRLVRRPGRARGDHRRRPSQPLVDVDRVAAMARTGPAGRLPGPRRPAPPRRPRVHVLRCPLLRPPQRLRQLRRHRVRPGVDIATDGEVRSFTIVTFAAPGVPVPFVSAIVDCDGTSVRGNIINVDPDPEHVTLGMKVQAGHVLARHRRQRDRSHRVRLRARLQLITTKEHSDERRHLDPRDQT